MSPSEAIILLLAGFLTPALAPQTPELPKSVGAAIRCVATIVVMDGQGEKMATGTGFLEPSGAVVTNWHVVSGGVSVDVVFSDGVRFKTSTVVGVDKAADLVFLQVPPNDATKKLLERSLTCDDATPSVGTHVWVIGSPRGLQGTVTDGIVSALRDIEGEGRRLQISAPISPGSSGSPVLSSAGKVIGVVAASIVDSQQLNFAVPSSAIGTVTRFSPISLVDLQRLFGTHATAPVKSPQPGSPDIAALQERIARAALSILDSQGGGVTRPGAGNSDCRELANRLMKSGVGGLRTMETRYGWPEDERGYSLTSFLYIFLDDAEKQSLADASSALVCKHLTNPEAWRLLWLTATVGFDPSTRGLAGRAEFEIARLEPSNRLARYDFLRRYYAGEASMTRIPTCEADQEPTPFGSPEWYEWIAKTQEPMYRLLDPETCITLMEELNAYTLTGSWQAIPAYCDVCSITSERRAFTRYAHAVSARPNEDSLLENYMNAEMIERKLRNELDPSSEAVGRIAAYTDELGKALHWRRLGIDNQIKRNELAKARGEVTPLVPFGWYSQQAFLQYLLRDYQSAAQSQELAAQLSSQLLQWSIDNLLADEQEYSLQSLTFSWQAAVREQCRLALLEKLRSGEPGATKVVKRIEESMSATVARLKDAHRASPTLKEAEAEIRKLVTQTSERLH